MADKQTSPTIAIHSRSDVLRRQAEIVTMCSDPELAQRLGSDNLYGSPASFWRDALEAGLVTKTERDQAFALCRTVWNYRGD